MIETLKIAFQRYWFFGLLAFALLLLTWSTFQLPFYWDTEWFLIPAAHSIAQTGNVLAYAGFSDYPHTFLLPLSLAVIIKILPDPLFGIHVFSYALSLFFLIVMYWTGKFFDKKTGVALSLLFLTNPLFLAQTSLVYFEIIGTALRYLALILLLNKKYRSFAIVGIVAILVRIENGLFLPLGTLAYFLLEYRGKQRWKNFWRHALPLIVVTAGWLCIHAWASGWWLYSPERFFDEQPLLALTDALNYLFFRQGRFVITFLGIALLIAHHKRAFTFILSQRMRIFLIALGSATLPTLLMIGKLGYFLPRYLSPVFPFFYFLFLILLGRSIKKPVFFWLIIVLVSFIQYWYRFDCYAGNFEDCLTVVKLLSNP